APDLAAFVRRGVDVDIAFAGLQVGKLRVGQRRRAGDRAGGVGRAERNRHPGIRAGRGDAMDVGGGSRTGQAGEFHLVWRLLCCPRARHPIGAAAHFGAGRGGPVAPCCPARLAYARRRMQGVILSTAEPSQADAAAPPLVARRSYGVWAAAAIAMLTVARLIWLGATTANLYPDEAQYWFWSLHPALGYYSKPPLVAWVIALATLAFGDSEFSVRLAAPLLPSIPAALLYGI